MTVTINGEEYLTAAEAAKHLGISNTTFAKFQEEYHLRWKKRPGLGNRKFFRKKDLDPLLEFQPGQEDGHKEAN